MLWVKMPELPEVETVCRTIAPHLEGQKVVDVVVRERRFRRLIPEDFATRLAGRTIQRVHRRGKYVILELGSGDRWAVHLGMSGRFLLGDPPAGARHVHVDVVFASGARVYLQDPRRFGACFLFREESELGNLGLEPLSEAFDQAALWTLRRAHPRLTIKTLLMDQRLVVGVGNIYANEALHQAGVRPTRRAHRLRRREAGRVVDAVREVLQRSISLGGSSLLDYRDAEGRPGTFQQTLRVYDREGELCQACGSEIRSRILGGRSTFWCPACQL